MRGSTRYWEAARVRAWGEDWCRLRLRRALWPWRPKRPFSAHAFYPGKYSCGVTYETGLMQARMAGYPPIWQ